jgi:hypothetical protein
VYFLLALAMFPRLGYARVWEKLTAGLAGLALPCPSEKALRDLRRRLGPAPMRALFEVVAGPLAQPHTPGVRFAGLRTVAFDALIGAAIGSAADRDEASLARRLLPLLHPACSCLRTTTQPVGSIKAAQPATLPSGRRPSPVQCRPHA